MLSSTSAASSSSLQQVQKKELNTTDANQSLWLVKIPQIVYENLASRRSGETIGTLKLQANKQVLVHLDGAAGDVPVTDYFLEEMSKGPQLVSFAHDIEGDYFSSKGVITKQGILRPKGDEKYREYCRNRTAMASTKTRVTRAVDATTIHSAPPVSHEVDFIPPAYVGSKRLSTDQKAHGVKKQKMATTDSKDIRNKIFQAFESRDKLTLKEISAACTSPEKDIKDLLKDYATFHQKGVYRNYWELKPEYRVHRGEGEAATGTTSTTSSSSTPTNL